MAFLTRTWTIVSNEYLKWFNNADAVTNNLNPDAYYEYVFTLYIYIYIYIRVSFTLL